MKNSFLISEKCSRELKASRLHPCEDCKAINKTNDPIRINKVEMPILLTIKGSQVPIYHVFC